MAPIFGEDRVARAGTLNLERFSQWNHVTNGMASDPIQRVDHVRFARKAILEAFCSNFESEQMQQKHKHQIRPRTRVYIPKKYSPSSLRANPMLVNVTRMSSISVRRGCSNRAATSSTVSAMSAC